MRSINLFRVKTLFDINLQRSKTLTIFTNRRISTQENGEATRNLQKYDLNKAVSEAEKVVGYPTSFLSLRWLLSDEIANIAQHLRKLVQSGHPVVKTAKYLLCSGKNGTQAWGLIVLLISKTVGHSSTIQEFEMDRSAGVLYSQRALAEISEMTRVSRLLHMSITNLQPTSTVPQKNYDSDDMILGNKISLLSGDYLLATACLKTAMLRNSDAFQLLASCTRDYSESQFIGDRDEQNRPLPSKPLKVKRIPSYEVFENDVEDDLILPLYNESAMGIPDKEWELRHMLGAGTLLTKSCQGALILAHQPIDVQKQGYLFAKHLFLAWQAGLDVESFKNSVLPLDTAFSLVSAPVLFHLEYDPDLYSEIEKGRISVDNVNFEKIHEAIIRGPGLQKTYDLQTKHINAAMKILDNFPPSEGRTALKNIVLAMRECKG